MHLSCGKPTWPSSCISSSERTKRNPHVTLVCPLARYLSNRSILPKCIRKIRISTSGKTSISRFMCLALRKSLIRIFRQNFVGRYYHHQVSRSVACIRATIFRHYLDSGRRDIEPPNRVWKRRGASAWSRDPDSDPFHKFGQYDPLLKLTHINLVPCVESSLHRYIFHAALMQESTIYRKKS